MAMLRRLSKARGKYRRRLRARASKYRQQMIARNRRSRSRNTGRNAGRKYGSLRGRMPGDFKSLLRELESSNTGRAARKKYKQFWGIPYPTEIVKTRLGAGRGRKIFVGMGRSPAVVLADGPKGRNARTWKDRKSRIVATDPSGRRIFVLTREWHRKPFGKNLRFVGYAPETHYVPWPGVERAGSFKKGKYWIHKHDDERGKWPKVFKDSSGNFIYGPGTYTVGTWIRR